MRDKHVANRFARLTDDFIDACQKEFKTGILLEAEDLAEQFPPETRTIIARESIDADRLVKAGPEVLIDRELKTFGDWMLLCISAFLKAILSEPDKEGDLDPELLQTAYVRSDEAMKLAANSPTASPLVNYTGVFMQLAYLARAKSMDESAVLLMRAIANENWQNGAEETEELLLELVGVWNRLGNHERADDLLAALIRWAPDAIAYYHLGSHYLREAGRNEAALALARRGLELVRSKGDEDDLGEALKVEVEELEAALAPPAVAPPAEPPTEAVEQPDAVAETEADPAPSTQAAADDTAPAEIATPASRVLLTALATDFDGGEDIDVEEFCATALPELASLPTKRDLTAEDVDGYEELQVPETFRRQGPKVGRNDPCPCGSGKKFKKCCA